MKNKPRKTTNGIRFQLFELVPITDPAELEAIDRRRKAAEKVARAAEKAAEKVYAAAARKAAKRKPRKRK